MTKREKVLLLVLGLGGVAYLLSRTTPGQAVTSRLLDLIASVVSGHEGNVLKVYQDEAGIWTVGRGHVIKPTDRVAAGVLYPYGPVQTITAADSDRFFELDSAAARNAVANAVNVPLNDNERAALVSLVFNIGTAAFAGSTLLRLLNQGNKAAAADQFLAWNKVTVNGAKQASAGLTTRRNDERALFLS